MLVTSLHTEETPADAIELLAAEGGALLAAADAAAAASRQRRGRRDRRAVPVPPPALRQRGVALAAAASSVYGMLRRTAEAGSREILTVAAQEEFVAPSQWFHAEPC